MFKKARADVDRILAAGQRLLDATQKREKCMQDLVTKVRSGDLIRLRWLKKLLPDYNFISYNGNIYLHIPTFSEVCFGFSFSEKNHHVALWPMYSLKLKKTITKYNYGDYGIYHRGFLECVKFLQELQPKKAKFIEKMSGTFNPNTDLTSTLAFLLCDVTYADDNASSVFVRDLLRRIKKIVC